MIVKFGQKIRVNKQKYIGNDYSHSCYKMVSDSMINHC